MNYEEHLDDAYDYFKSKHPEWSIGKLNYWSEQAAIRLSKYIEKEEEHYARQFN